MAGLNAYQNSKPGWFKIPANESREIYIPIELHEMHRAVVHASPNNFMKSAVCTWTEDSECYGCDQGTFQWAGRVKIFIPVVENGKTSIFAQGTGVNSLLWPLANQFQETGTSVGWFEVSRTGLGKRSKYMAKSIDSTAKVRYNRRIDLSGHITHIDYLDQEKYYR